MQILVTAHIGTLHGGRQLAHKVFNSESNKVDITTAKFAGLNENKYSNPRILSQIDIKHKN